MTADIYRLADYRSAPDVHELAAQLYEDAMCLFVIGPLMLWSWWWTDLCPHSQMAGD